MDNNFYENRERRQRNNRENDNKIVMTRMDEGFIKKVNSTLITLSKEKYLIKNKA